MRRIKRFHSIRRRHGLRCALATTKEHLLYNFGWMYMRRYSPEDFDSTNHDSDEIIWVSPDQIKYFQPSLFDKFVPGFVQLETHNPVVSGQWDRLRVSFEDRVFYRSLEEHFAQGIPWDDTIFYRQAIDDINSRREAYRDVVNQNQLREVFDSIDELFASINKSGVKRATELGEPVSSEITVNITRNGELIQSVNGKHRTAIGKLLDVEEMPVRVLVRHAKWKDVNCIDETSGS